MEVEGRLYEDGGGASEEGEEEWPAPNPWLAQGYRPWLGRGQEEEAEADLREGDPAEDTRLDEKLAAAQTDLIETECVVRIPRDALCRWVEAQASGAKGAASTSE